MTLYCGIDLHSTNSLVSVTDEQDKPVYEKRLPNKLDRIVVALAPYRDELCGVVVESTYNGYWLVDGLMEADFAVHLANTGAIKQYEGLKHGDDITDARCVKSERFSNGKRKGSGNRKNGNKYLGWAFVEAAHFAIRWEPKIRACHQRKLAKAAHPMVALKAVANKLARACYYVLLRQEPFDVNRAFSG